jgi:hypothetical protein
LLRNKGVELKKDSSEGVLFQSVHPPLAEIAEIWLKNPKFWIFVLTKITVDVFYAEIVQSGRF